MLKINRINHAVDHNLPYQILLDGKPIMEIYSGEVKDYPLKPGKYKLEVKCKNLYSQPVSFEIGDGQIVEFLVKPDHKETFASKMMHSLLFSHDAISLTIKKDFYI